MRLFLGVDGGQTATKVVVGDETGRIVGRGRSGPCNHVGAGEDGREKLCRAVAEAVEQALNGPLRDVRFEAAYCGMSGGPADKREILAELLLADRLEATTDAHAALLGALAGEPGVVVISGTGSIALARTADGKTARAGGWGYVFGDEGSAFDIVRQALRAALRYEEGYGPETALGYRLEREAGCSDANQLLHAWYTAEWPRSRVAGLLPVVVEAAEAGDSVARALLEAAGQALAALAVAARRAAFASDERWPVSYVGGVFDAAPRVLEAFSRRVDPVVPPAAPPDVGALLGAYALAGLRVSAVAGVAAKESS